MALIVGYAPIGQDPVNTWFALFVFVSIMVSSVCLAMDGPTLDDDSDFKMVLNILDVFFTVIFTIEMVMKIIVYGFIFTPEAYLKDGWNVLDFLIVLTSVLALPSNAALSSDAENSPFKSLSMLRAFRALRPLRMINRSPGLKCVMDAIFHCMPAFINIGLVTGLVYLVFAIMGVQLWAGKFWSCSLEGVKDVQECVLKGGTWANKPLNFDDVLNAQLTLFEVSSLEIWLDVMYAAMDVPTNIGEQPVRNQSWAWALYFVVFIVIGSFLMLNLFVGAVVDNFTKIKAQQGKEHALMTKQQEEFIQSIDTMLNKAPAPKLQPPEKDTTFGKFRWRVFKIIQYDFSTGKSARWGNPPLFDQVIMALISMNILVMAAPIWNQPTLPPPRGSVGVAPDTKEYLTSQETDWNKGLDQVNTIFNFVFLLEATTKIVGLGKKQYFESAMNVFDFCIVCISLVGFIIDLAVEDVDPSLISVISVIKAGRVIRIFRLAMRVKGIRNLLETLIFTLPSLFNVACLLVIVLFIYTILGMAFFGDQKFDMPPFQLYNAHANFRYFHIGFFTLFRMSTGESWNGIMHDSMEQVSGYAWIFYCSYMIVGSNLLLQLIVAVLLEQFTNAASQEEAPITPDHISYFADTWKEYDPKGTQFIDGTQLGMFLENLGEPMGLPPNSSVVVLRKFLAETELKVANHRAHYVETFFALVQNVYSKRYRHRWTGSIDRGKLEEMTKQLRDKFPSLDENTQAIREGATLDDPIDALSATKIQAMVRKKQASHKVNQKAITKIGRPLAKSSPQGSVNGTPRKEEDQKVEAAGAVAASSPDTKLALDSSSLLADASVSPGSRPLSHRASPPGLPPISGADGLSPPNTSDSLQLSPKGVLPEAAAPPKSEAAAPPQSEDEKPQSEDEKKSGDEPVDEDKPVEDSAL